MSRTANCAKGLRYLTYRAPSGCLRPKRAMDELAYYGMRMRQEKEAARAATCPNARECHEELAAAYEFRCRLLNEQLRSTEERRLEEAIESQNF